MKGIKVDFVEPVDSINQEDTDMFELFIDDNIEHEIQRCDQTYNPSFSNSKQKDLH